MGADSNPQNGLDYGAAVPYASLRGGADSSRKGFYVRWAVICATATAVLGVVAWKGGGGGAEKFTTGGEGSSLGGAYYAVAKPPAFNFNREDPFPRKLCVLVDMSLRAISPPPPPAPWISPLICEPNKNQQDSSKTPGYTMVGHQTLGPRASSRRWRRGTITS